MTPSFTDGSETWQQHILVNVEITGLQKMLKLISLRPETQADTTLRVCEFSVSKARGIAAIVETTGTGQVGTGYVLQSTQCCQVSFSGQNFA
jgi:hypothetical protein